MSAEPKVTQGLHEGMSAEFYHMQKWAVSNSDLKVFGGESPAHYLAMLNGAKEDDSGLTDDERKARVMGTLAHTAILEPSRFGREKSHYVKPLTYTDDKGKEKPWNGNSKVCQEWLEAHADKPVINEKEERRVIGARDAVLNHPVAGALVTGTGSNEVSVFAKHPATGLCLRMRADRLTEDADGNPWCVDLKKCPNVKAFVWSARDYRYQIQSEFYSAVLALAGIENVNFCFIAFELVPNYGIYAVRVVMLDYETKKAARATYEAELERLAECRRTNVWPQGNEDIELITVRNFKP